jgi:transposase
VREYIEALNGAIQIEQLPAYAPELNPTEYIWGHLKHHELANRCAGDFANLKTGARNPPRSMQRRPTLIRAFWHQAELPNRGAAYGFFGARKLGDCLMPCRRT